MRTKNCLIIDNDRQVNIINNLKTKGKRLGLEIVCQEFNVGHPTERAILDANNKIESEKLKTEYKRRFSKSKFDLICLDYNLEADGINGLEVLRQIKEFAHSSVKFLIYSGKLDAILYAFLDTPKKDSNKRKDAINQIKIMLRAGVVDFVERENYEQSILDILSQHEKTLDDIFRDKMSLYPDFKTSFFEDIKIESLSQLLNERDMRALKFKQELVEQFVAYIIRLNGK